MNLAFGFILRKKDGGFRYFYAYENNALLYWPDIVCTRDDLAKLKDFYNKTDVLESCSRERMNTQWRFYKMINLTVFAALVKDVPMGCKDAVLSELLLKNLTVNCLTYKGNESQSYNDNLCLFRALVLHLQRNKRLENETSQIFIAFMSRMDKLSPSQLQGVHMNDISIVEDLLLLIVLLYDIDNVEGSILSELAWRSVKRLENTVWLLRYNLHICCVININAVFQSFRCPNCDIFFNRRAKLQQNLTKCSEWVKNVYPRNVSQIQEILLDKLGSFGFKYTCEQKRIKNLTLFNFESICVQHETFRDTNNTTWMGNISRHPYPFFQTFCKNKLSSATLILIVCLHLLLELLKT